MPDISIHELNAKLSKNAEETVLTSEKNYKRLIEDVAKEVAANDRIKIILLAGPSGSGKTTSANLLSDEINRNGKKSFVVSLDNFYRSAQDPLYPTLPDGSRDYESPEALDIPFLRQVLSDIAEGNEFSLPRYDFKVGGRVSVTKYEKISHGCVVIEGLHALNPMVFEMLPPDSMLRIFVSVSTNIVDGDRRLISGRKMRFIRRMVRDSLYRAASAERTLAMWQNVLDGENAYLYPFRKYADVRFNTFHEFELAAMKKHAIDLIDDDLAAREPYARTVKNALEASVSIPDEIVPQDSLIREFIPGGIYEELY